MTHTSLIRRMRSWPLLLVALAATSMLLIACDGDEDGDANGTPDATDGTPVAGTDGTETPEATEPADGEDGDDGEDQPAVEATFGLAPAGSPTPGPTEATAGGSGQQLALEANIGQEAPEDLITEWDIDITPDGNGLWDAEGTVAEGAEVFANSCARCHAPDGTGSDLAPQLVLEEGEPGPWEYGAPRTVANYWPYLTTYIDYINRSMPFDNPDTLSPEEVYSVVAWILSENGMIEEDAALNPDTIMEMNELPNHDSFFPCYPDECRPLEGLQGGGP